MAGGYAINPSNGHEVVAWKSEIDGATPESIANRKDDGVLKGVHQYRYLLVSLTDGEVINDGTDTETVTVEVVDGLEVARGTDPATASVLDYNGDVTLTVDGAETTKTLSAGSMSFDITTTKSAGETIEVVAQDLVDHPAESDSATIEVIE